MDAYYCALTQIEINHFFDFSFAPPLLFYAYIPIILLSLFFGIYVFVKDKHSLQGALLLALTLSFVFWVINILFQWVAVYAKIVYFSGELVAFFEVPIFLLSIYFVQVFLTKKDITFGGKLFLGSIAFLNLVLVSTKINIASFDPVNCEVNVGLLWPYIYGGEIVAIVYILYLCVRGFRRAGDKNIREQIVHFTLAVFAFLSIFVASNIFGEITRVYSINLFGPMGMVIFLGVMAYMIVKYQTFNIKMFATQVLVIGIAFLIGSRLFYSTTIDGLILSIVTLIAFLASGFFLVKSVKGEIKQREEKERLAQNLAIANKDLETANKGQENLIHIINHQIKGYLATARNIFAELSQSNDYGQMPEASIPLLTKGFEEMGEGVDYVQGILKSSSAQSGTLPYDMKQVDLKALISDLVSKQKENAEKEGLSFESHIADGDYAITGDSTMLEEAFKNLITNAIRYNNPNGSITVTLSHPDGKILFSVKDTGRGITAEDQKKLYTPGGMGKDSMKYNANASGYGLAFVKPVVEKHQGTIWYETEVEKGTTFFVELPIKPVS